MAFAGLDLVSETKGLSEAPSKPVKRSSDSLPAEAGWQGRIRGDMGMAEQKVQLVIFVGASPWSLERRI
jgi:hypothetical protein